MAKLPTVCRRLALSLTCIRLSAVTFVVGLSFGAVVLAQQQRPPASPSGLGRPVTQTELKAWDISVGPDGAELPPGSGNVSQGTLIFTQRGCSDCHGPTGKEGPAPVLVGGNVTNGTNAYPI